LLTAEEFAGAQTALDLPQAQGQSPASPRKAKPRAPGPWADMGREPSQVQSPLISAEQRAAEALRTEQLRAILRQTQARTPNIADLKLPEFMGENVPMSDPRLQNVPVIQPGPAEFVGPGASPELSDPMLRNVPVQRPQRPPVLGESPNVRPGPALLEPQGVRPGFPPQRPQLGTPMERGLARAETMFPRNTPEGVVYEPRGVRPDVLQLGPGNAMMRPELSLNPQPGLDPRGVRPGFTPQQPALPAVAGENPTMFAPTMDANTQIPKLDPMTQRMPSEALTRNAGGPPNRPMPPGPGAGQSLLSILGGLAAGMGAVDTKRMLEQGRWQDALAAGLPTGGALAAARGIGGGLARGLGGIPGALLYGLGRANEISDGTISGLPEDHPDKIAMRKLAEDRAINSARQSTGVRRATRTDDGRDPYMRTFRMAPLTPGEEPAPGAMLNPDFFGPAPKKPAPRPPRRTAPTPAARTSVMPSFDLGGPTMRLPEREPMGLGIPDLQLGKRQVLRPDANESEVSSDDFEQSLMDLELLKQLKRQMGGAVTRPGFAGRGPDNLPFYSR